METQIIASKFSDKTGLVSSTEQTNNFNMAKVNYPENAIIYINQVYLTGKNNKKMYYADFFILDQVIEALNSHENITNYVCKEKEVKLIRPRYDPSTGDFLGLYKTVGFIVVRGDEEEHFLNYGYDGNKSKLLYSFYEHRIPNSFGGTLFNRYRVMFESGELKATFSKIISSFLPSLIEVRK